ncbi:hypothetical protein CPSG_02237 [Coccidioides posadasii str. Silveira]|uniref:Uncharacterized protein n=1 Tax=Coccidioides posadasii (strain RMSCC 757 / Silveira) TaxID=443226 RepID=E9CV81_COCPS|nr:hypothetical protein CPSG_02237 [Coccidioides posadasii str. Silveira]
MPIMQATYQFNLPILKRACLFPPPPSLVRSRIPFFHQRYSRVTTRPTLSCHSPYKPVAPEPLSMELRTAFQHPLRRPYTPYGVAVSSSVAKKRYRPVLSSRLYYISYILCPSKLGKCSRSLEYALAPHRAN